LNLVIQKDLPPLKSKNKMASCTIFRNFAFPVENKALIVISNWIASDKFKTEISEIQSLFADGKAYEAQEKKKKLLAFTPSATFTDKRLFTHIDKYSGFVHLDFDKLEAELLETAFQFIALIPYTALCFRSPSGRGLKVFVEVNTDMEHHEQAYAQVMQFYEKETGLKADEKCKDITRLCFMSHDLKLYKNLNPQKFEVIVSPNVQTSPIKQSPPHLGELEGVKEEALNEVNEEVNYEPILHDCIRFTEQMKTYTEGSRNDFIYLFASNCNRKGIPEQFALQFAQAKYDLSSREMISSFRSAYSHHNTEFAKFANSAIPQSTEQLTPIIIII